MAWIIYLDKGNVGMFSIAIGISVRVTFVGGMNIDCIYGDYH